MKNIMICCCCLWALASALGQGTVIFDNKNLTTGEAPVSYHAGGRLSGTNFSAQLYSAPGDQLSNVSALTAAETRAGFRGGLNDGFVQLSGINPFTGQPVDQEVTVTPTANGPATIQMRAWESRFATYEDAVAGGGCYGGSAPIFLAATGGGLLPAVELTGLQGFTMCIPEPSTLALAGIGCLLILAFKRKSS